jgi:hypothetical protein
VRRCGPGRRTVVQATALEGLCVRLAAPRGQAWDGMRCNFCGSERDLVPAGLEGSVEEWQCRSDEDCLRRWRKANRPSVLDRAHVAAPVADMAREVHAGLASRGELADVMRELRALAGSARSPGSSPSPPPAPPSGWEHVFGVQRQNFILLGDPRLGYARVPVTNWAAIPREPDEAGDDRRRTAGTARRSSPGSSGSPSSSSRSSPSRSSSPAASGTARRRRR